MSENERFFKTFDGTKNLKCKTLFVFDSLYVRYLLIGHSRFITVNIKSLAYDIVVTVQAENGFKRDGQLSFSNWNN